jgi:hypothetical protein
VTIIAAIPNPGNRRMANRSASSDEQVRMRARCGNAASL